MTVPSAPIELQRIRYLRGPNLWTYRPVLETWLDLGEFEDWPSNRLGGFNERLCTLLPALVEHHCGVGERGGFLQRLEEGTWLGHVLEHVVIELLNLAGMPTGFGQTRSTSRRGVYRMVFRARDEQVARTALAQGHELLSAAIQGRAFDVDAAVARIRDQVDDSYLGPSTAAIVNAATDRKIPHIRLNSGNLVQLGHGARQRRIWTAETDRTSAIGESIASDKDLTKQLLKSVGVPVPEGEVAESPEAAWEAAQDIGLPVVVKPSDANHGRGVSLELMTEADVKAAWSIADAEGSQVLVERYIRGDEHRLLVVDGRVVAAARGESLWVTGDGRSSVAALIEQQLNSDPRRGEAEEFPLETIRLEREPAMRLLLERQGLSGEAVPAVGRKVLVQRNGNVSIDCTDDVHPDVDHVVSLAARVVGLDIAGIDMVCEDVSRPLADQGGAIVEVNAGPGLLMHLRPAVGMPRPVGHAIVDHLFAEDETGRIPIVGVTGSAAQTTIVARLVAWLAHLSGRPTGLACRDGLYLGSRRLERGDRSDYDSGQRLLINRQVELAVFEHGAAGILRDGLPYDRCQVGIVTDLGGLDGLEDDDVRDADQMVKVLRTQIDVVLSDGTGVLHAADPRVAALAELCDGSVILYAHTGGANASPTAAATIEQHRAQGGRAVYTRDGRAVFAGPAGETLGPTLNARRQRGVPTEAALAAIAAAWALGIAPELIAAGLATFESDALAA